MFTPEGRTSPFEEEVTSEEDSSGRRMKPPLFDQRRFILW